MKEKYDRLSEDKDKITINIDHNNKYTTLYCDWMEDSILEFGATNISQYNSLRKNLKTISKLFNYPFCLLVGNYKY